MRPARPVARAISVAVALTLHSAALRADLEEVASFSIPPQSLSSALIQFSNQADVQVVGNTDTLANLDTAGVSGQLTGREALQRLLGKHALRFEEVSNRSVKILPQGASETAANGSAQPSGWSVTLAHTPGGQDSAFHRTDDNLPEVVVHGLNFKFSTVETANKMSLAVKDTPQSVKVITADMLDFSGIRKFEDAYKVDAGAHTSHAQDGFLRNYFRGFKLDSRNALKLDGLRMPGVLVFDLAPFERFEIIKGATSTVYGQGLVAGTLNAVSKRPRSDSGGTFALESGSFGHYRGDIDVYGALTRDQRLASRLVASYLDEDSFLDFAHTRHAVLAPSLRYEFGPDTSMTLLTQYQKQDFLQSYGFGVQILDGDPADPATYRLPDVPRSRFAALPTGGKESEVVFSRMLFEHRFTQGWQLRANLQYADTEVFSSGSLGVVTDADGLTNIEMYRNERETEAYGGEVNLFGNVELAGREHTLFIGMDFMKDVDHKGLYAFVSLPGTLTGFSIFTPDYSLLPATPQGIRSYTTANIPQSDYSEFGNGVGFVQEAGLTAQAIVHAMDRLTFLLGARYSDVKHGDRRACCDESVLEPFPPGYASSWSNHATTLQAGATFALNANINVYASYGETFLPRFAYSSPGNRVGPEEGTAIELGFKGEALERQLAWSVAAFDIARTNIAQHDNLPGDYVVLIGEQRSQGVEFDVQGELAPGWDVYGSAALLDNEFVEGQYAGFPSFTAPKVGVSVFTSYEIQGGALQGLGFGGGVVYKERGRFRAFFGPAQGQYFDHLFDDATELDARVFYARRHWNFHLAATNLFNSRYYSPEDNNFYNAIAANPGRQVIGRVAYRF